MKPAYIAEPPYQLIHNNIVDKITKEAVAQIRQEAIDARLWIGIWTIKGQIQERINWK